MFGQHHHWRLAALASLAVVAVTSIPQAGFLVQRGRNWHGSYVFTDADELTYSAYLGSLIEGRPRKNNPYLGNEGASAEATGENYYSIQFVPPYVVALPARLMRLSASTAFILLIPIIAFASSLVIFWLLLEIANDEKFAASGALIILLCGVLVSESPFALANQYGGFPFLRRYIPAVAFPLFFLFCLFIWRAFTQRTRSALLWSFAAGVTFSALIYSYFYLWTAAGAWLCCLTAVWFLARPIDRAHVSRCLLIFGAVAVSALVPYLRMLSLRAQTMDRSQVLVLTHAPDPFRFVEIIGALLLVALALQARRGKVNWRSPLALFAASCAASPFVVLNQQVITGHSLQSFHYEQFIMNYVVLIGLVITYKLIWWKLRIRAALWVTLVLVAGVVTALKTSAEASQLNGERDEAIPVFGRTEENIKRNRFQGVVLFDSALLASSAPTSSSLGMLWSPYMYTFGSTTESEEMERFYQYLYYLGVVDKRFARGLEDDSLFRATVFGLHRVNSKLTRNFQPISEEEIKAQVQLYSDYVEGFSHEQAVKWPLCYVILRDGRFYDLSNLDRWYERDGGERIGSFTLYAVRMRP